MNDHTRPTGKTMNQTGSTEFAVRRVVCISTRPCDKSPLGHCVNTPLPGQLVQDPAAPNSEPMRTREMKRDEKTLTRAADLLSEFRNLTEELQLQIVLHFRNGETQYNLLQRTLRCIQCPLHLLDFYLSADTDNQD